MISLENVLIFKKFFIIFLRLGYFISLVLSIDCNFLYNIVLKYIIRIFLFFLCFRMEFVKDFVFFSNSIVLLFLVGF